MPKSSRILWGGVLLSLSLIVFYLLFFPESDSKFLDVQLDSQEMFPVGGSSSECNIQLKLFGAGQHYETPYYIFDGTKKGPTIVVEGGIHGNEIAGSYALDKLVYKIQIKNGKVIFIPRMNLPACQRNIRSVNVDMNRVFANLDSIISYEYAIAKEITNLVKDEGVEYVLTLHESKYQHDPETQKNYGQTIVYGKKEAYTYLERWMELINLNSTSKEETFYAYYSPVEGSATETLVDSFEMKGGFSVETWKGLPMNRRILLQEKVILSFFETVGLDYHLHDNIFE